MKNYKYIIILIILIGVSSITFSYIKKQNKKEDNTTIITDKEQNNEAINNEEEPFKDPNPIAVSLYKYYGRGKAREKITEYTNTWKYHTDISSFEVYYTTESTLKISNQQTLFDEYLKMHTDYNNYKIGYNVKFLINNKEINKTILSPKDTEEIFDYLELYLYDDYHRTPGVWYSHTTEEEMNEETLLTSIKLTSGKLVDEITSDITLTVFTYDITDTENKAFTENNEYIGNSKYSITIKRS